MEVGIPAQRAESGGEGSLVSSAMQVHVYL